MLRRTLLAAATLTTLGAASAPRLGPGTRSPSAPHPGAGPPAASEGERPASTRVKALDGVLRFDQEAQREGEPPGYTLVNIATHSLTLVMPGSRKYMQFNFDSTAGMVVQAMARPRR